MFWTQTYGKTTSTNVKLVSQNTAFKTSEGNCFTFFRGKNKRQSAWKSLFFFFVSFIWFNSGFLNWLSRFIDQNVLTQVTPFTNHNIQPGKEVFHFFSINKHIKNLKRLGEVHFFEIPPIEFFSMSRKIQILKSRKVKLQSVNNKTYEKWTPLRKVRFETQNKKH